MGGYWSMFWLPQLSMTADGFFKEKKLLDSLRDTGIRNENAGGIFI
jgi:hypothetical protein